MAIGNLSQRMSYIYHVYTVYCVYFVLVNSYSTTLPIYVTHICIYVFFPKELVGNYLMTYYWFLENWYILYVYIYVYNLCIIYNENTTHSRYNGYLIDT